MMEKDLMKNAIEKSFERIVRELFPMGTRNAAMKKKEHAVSIVMEELSKICE